LKSLSIFKKCRMFKQAIQLVSHRKMSANEYENTMYGRLTNFSKLLGKGNTQGDIPSRGVMGLPRQLEKIECNVVIMEQSKYNTKSPLPSLPRHL